MVAAVLFDCDGVLADSEAIANTLVADDLTARGWAMSPHEAERRFLGLSLPQMMPLIEAALGTMPPGWAEALSERIAEEMGRRVIAIEGALEAVASVRAMGLGHAVGSNSSRAELEAKLARLGLAEAFGGRVVSYQDVSAGKPAPDIWLRCATLVGAGPEACVVVEDSIAGVRAGRAAGMRVLGYAPPGSSPGGTAEALAREGARPFARMAALPALIEELRGE
ncbi:HAD family hydrolase [Elioraea rosea]|uniref:HAD family hydrolase n=1 Tax=Elioraea rosea TaxID=2492390 RepID=UPI001EF4D127|nr:HAD family phosphatase [Elioraea rosea]